VLKAPLNPNQPPIPSYRVPCQFCATVCLLVCPLVTSVYCGKTTDSFEMLFETVGRVGPTNYVLDVGQEFPQGSAGKGGEGMDDPADFELVMGLYTLALVPLSQVVRGHRRGLLQSPGGRSDTLIA